MQPETDIVSALRLAGVTVGLVCFVTFYLQRKLHPLFAVSAVMFLAFSLTYLDHLARAFLPDLSIRELHAIHMVAYSAAFVVLPTFYLKYKLLRNLGHEITRAEVARHGILPAIAACCAFTSVWIPSYVFAPVHEGHDLGAQALWVQVSIISLFVLEPVAYIQWMFYTVLIAWTHWRGRAEFKRSFGSDARAETAWITAMIMVLMVYTTTTMISFVFRSKTGVGVMTPAFDTAVVLVFMLLAAINSLRQTPGPIGWTQGKTSAVKTSGPARKYSKSALAEEHADRIARKLTAAMRDDFLYRDANLSLTKLAQHIGSSPNYVSQTLNEHMHQSFFDFVNTWRIKEAEELLSNHRGDTILTITYDVGFNSRSAFYTAFKKHIGVTPTEYRSQNKEPQTRSNGLSPPSARRA